MLTQHKLDAKVCSSNRICGCTLTIYVTQILALNADNAASNDTQVTTLAAMPNSFDTVNRVRCFNHTLQLSAKALLKPFNVGLASGKDASTPDADADSSDVGTNDGPLLSTDSDDDENADDRDGDPEDGIEDDADEPSELDEAELADLMEKTAVVRAVVSKVCPVLIHVMLTGLILCNPRFDSSRSPSSIQPQLHCQPGVVSVMISMSKQS
jgi:hypothetical protein